METSELINHINTLISTASTIGGSDGAKFRGVKARACDFLATFGGSKNPFLAQIAQLSGSSPSYLFGLILKMPLIPCNTIN